MGAFSFGQILSFLKKLFKTLVQRGMDIEKIRTKVRANLYVYTLHAEIERKADGLT